MTAPTDRATFIEHMRGARIVVALPNPTEGFYLPALEAMKLGKAVICPDAVGNRTLRVSVRTMVVSNVDISDFSLYIKHPSFFSAALPFLIQAFDCYASIRNPLSVLRSWQDCPFPVSRGRAPAAEQISPNLRARLDAESDVLSRQLVLLDFLFDRYHRFIPNRVIRYEDIVSSGGHALEMINAQAHLLDENLVSRNSRGIGGRPSAQLVADRLLASDNSCWNFYTRDDVQSLLDAGGQ